MIHDHSAAIADPPFRSLSLLSREARFADDARRAQDGKSVAVSGIVVCERRLDWLTVLSLSMGLRTVMNHAG